MLHRLIFWHLIEIIKTCNMNSFERIMTSNKAIEFSLKQAHFCNKCWNGISSYSLQTQFIYDLECRNRIHTPQVICCLFEFGDLHRNRIETSIKVQSVSI